MERKFQKLNSGKRKWQDFEEEDSVEEEEGEIEDLLEKFVASQKQLLEECQKLRELLSMVHSTLQTLGHLPK